MSSCSGTLPSLCRPRRPLSYIGVANRSNGNCDWDRKAALPPGAGKPPRGCDMARGAGDEDRGARVRSSSPSRHSSLRAKIALSGRCVRI